MSEIRLLGVDVDGTLVHAKVLEDRDVQALHRACSAGLVVCLCTGRAWDEVKPVWEALHLPPPHAPVICVGGALVVEPDSGRSLYTRPFERPVAEELAATLRLLGYPVMALVDAWREGFDYYLLGPYEDQPMYRRFIDGRSVRLRRVERLEGPFVRPLRINVLEEPGKAAGVVERLRTQFAGRIEVQAIWAPNYGVHIVEAFSAKATKHTAMVYVGQGYQIPPTAMAAIGDDHNDVAMLEGAGLSAAPADAPPEVRASADLILAPRGQGAVAQFVEHLLKKST